MSRQSHHNGYDIQSVALLGSAGRDDDLAETYPRVSLRLLWLFYRCVCRRHDRRLSQLDNTNGRLVTDIIESMLHSRWSYAIPMPIFFALSGNLVGKWFSEFDLGRDSGKFCRLLNYSPTHNSADTVFVRHCLSTNTHWLPFYYCYSELWLLRRLDVSFIR